MNFFSATSTLISQGSKLSHLDSLPLVVILVLVCIVTSGVSQVKYNISMYISSVFELLTSQVASNATTTTMMVPVVLALSDSLGVNPLYLALGHVYLVYFCIFKNCYPYRCDSHCKPRLHASSLHPLQCYCVQCWEGEICINV